MLDSAILTHQLEFPVAALPSEEPLGQRRKTMRQLGNYKDFSSAEVSRFGSLVFRSPIDWKHPIRVRGRHDGKEELKSFSKREKQSRITEHRTSSLYTLKIWYFGALDH